MAITPAQRRKGTTSGQTVNLGLPQVGVTPKPGTTTGTPTTLGGGSVINVNDPVDALRKTGTSTGTGTGTGTGTTTTTTKPTPPTNEDDCLKAGGRWVEGVCQMYEKEPEYKPQPAVSQQKTPESATGLLKKKQDAGDPVAKGVASTFLSQVQGLGDQMYKLEAMGINEAKKNALRTQLQNDAAVGRAFSMSNMDAQTDIIREAALRRLNAKDATEAKQAELDMMAAEQAQNAMLLAEQGKLAPGAAGVFAPGAIPTSSFMPSGQNLGLGALPAVTDLPTTWPGKPGAAEAKAEQEDADAPYEDPGGFKCKYGDLDKNDNCPTNPKYVHPPEGGDKEG